MIIKTLDELRQVDPRTLRFTPMGLGLGVQMRPEDAAEFQQQVVAQFELAPQVAEGTRSSFEALRKAFAYGVFCYEIFTWSTTAACWCSNRRCGTGSSSTTRAP